MLSKDKLIPGGCGFVNNPVDHMLLNNQRKAARPEIERSLSHCWSQTTDVLVQYQDQKPNNRNRP